MLAIKSRPFSFTNISLPQLKTGDVILRRGKGLVSSWFIKMSLKDPRYSHAGLIYCENDKIYVLHAYQESAVHGLVKQSLDEFTDPDLCDRFVIYRYDFNNLQREKVRTRMLNDLKSDLPFDDDFKLNNGRQVYCTEWIHDCINISMNNNNYIPETSAAGYNYISTDNLYINSHSLKIWQQQY